MDLVKLFRDLGFSENTASVYRELLGLKKATARQLSINLDMPRPSVYDHLKLLISEGLVNELEVENKKYFQIDDPESIENLIQNQIDNLEIEKKKIKRELAKLRDGGGRAEPRVKFYAGRDGYRQVLTDILLHPKVEVLAFWPYEEMTRVAGDEYLSLWTKRRVAQGIKIRSVWPFGTKASGEIPLEQIRIAPKGTDWDMGYAIYNHKVAFISSREESFGFTVQSRDFALLMRAQFEIVWQSSKLMKT